VAFVRQRHGLDNGDLDRTHRQQAFLVSVLHQLQDEGAVTDVTRFNQLVETAQKDVVLSSGWGPEQFSRISTIADGDIQFQTLPVVRYDSIDGSDVNIVDPDAIRAQVAAACGGSAPTTTTESRPTSTVDVINAGDTSGLANTVSQWLGKRGYSAGQVRNSLPGEPAATAVGYGGDAEVDAAAVASMLGVTASPKADSDLAGGHVRVVLGPDYVLPATFDSAVAETEVAGAADAADAAPPDQGQPVNGQRIPCVD
jgi:hypothetical protein